MATRSIFTKSLPTPAATNIALSQTPATAALTLNGAAVTGGVATIDTASATNQAPGQLVGILSGGDDSGIFWTVVGTDETGQSITDTFAGSNGGTAQSNLSFVTVTSITPSANVASTAQAGTIGFGASPWWMVNYRGYSPVNVGVAVELISGAANFTIQHTYDDPMMLDSGLVFPVAFNSPVIFGQSATVDAAYVTPIVAVRLFINSGTGVLRTRFVQAGVG